LSERAPDVIGLKDVALEAGVSHSLVSHYFGTYAELVESVLTERIRRIRGETLARLMTPAGTLDAARLLDVVFSALEDPVYIRLSLWALAANRPLSKDALPFREQGMRLVAEAVTAPPRFGAAASSGASSGSTGGGAIRARHVLAGARTPAYFTVWQRGGGTLVASRQSSDSGSMSTATVPSA